MDLPPRTQNPPSEFQCVAELPAQLLRSIYNGNNVDQILGTLESTEWHRYSTSPSISRGRLARPRLLHGPDLDLKWIRMPTETVEFQRTKLDVNHADNQEHQ